MNPESDSVIIAKRVVREFLGLEEWQVIPYHFVSLCDAIAVELQKMEHG